MSLENVKVGDWIKVQVTEVDLDRKYSIRCSEDLSFTLDGSYCQGFNQIAFPLESTERWMMVSIDLKNWVKRKVVMNKNGRFLVWNDAETDEQVNNTIRTSWWKYAKEIEEHQVELTLEEIAEKFGVNVNQIKIKK
jgi:exosome complex RNA-binding protein Rrp4